MYRVHRLMLISISLAFKQIDGDSMPFNSDGEMRDDDGSEVRSSNGRHFEYDFLHLDR